MQARRVAILGSTGSIGLSACRVAEHLGPAVKITGLAAGRNARKLLEQAKRFSPKIVGLADAKSASWLRGKLKRLKKPPRLVAGPGALEAVATERASDMVLTSVVGARGLVPTLEAIWAGKDIALANKETLVAAGELVSREASRKKVSILPVDSEHNAIFQCLAGLPNRHEVRRLILTASGGPFRGWGKARLARVKPKDALKHPTWKMGAKITVDSATLMNKGLEVIEAHWLFGLDYSRIDVVVHPQSVIHSMVETVDQSVLAQLGPTDMRLPIQFAFTWPKRLEGGTKALDFAALKDLSFEKPDKASFGCLGLAYQAGRAGGGAPAVLNAANEVAVQSFLDGRLSFTGIPVLLKRVLTNFSRRPKRRLTLQSILEDDAWARRSASELLERGN